MARTFSKNTSNYMKLGAAAIGNLWNGQGKIWVSAWVNATTTTAAANDNRVVTVVILNSTAGFILALDKTGANRVVRVGARSKSADSLQSRLGTSNIPLSTWVHIGGVADFGAGTITPYYAGVAENSGAATFGSTTFTLGGGITDNDFIGCGGVSTPSNTGVQVDGGIAYVTYGIGDPGANGFAAMAAGGDPQLIVPGLIVSDFDILGFASPEPDYWGQKSGTITGSLPQLDPPPTFLAFRPTIIDPGVAAAGASIRMASTLLQQAQSDIRPGSTSGPSLLTSAIRSGDRPPQKILSQESQVPMIVVNW